MEAVQKLTNLQIGNGAEEGDQLLTFILAGEEYGVDILRVQEIKGWDSVTPIPNTPAHIRGVINLRGTIVPIVDLRLRFGLPAIPYGPTTVVIVLKVQCVDKSRVMGIVVDAVSDVYNIDENTMKAPPNFGGAISIEFLKGLVSVDEKMVIVLNIDHMLNADDMAMLAKASDAKSE
ncbi:MAG: chemotaxis protein CheW [Gammaproteobacteria bacterium]|nr:chemotaxis protein CheW [Gammaproteobacteria bacterium]MDH5802655.1 chemotaxis protein CheW [Gammaproteobacteria bacterium]